MAGKNRKRYAVAFLDKGTSLDDPSPWRISGDNPYNELMTKKKAAERMEELMRVPSSFFRVAKVVEIDVSL